MYNHLYKTHLFENKYAENENVKFRKYFNRNIITNEMFNQIIKGMKEYPFYILNLSAIDKLIISIENDTVSVNSQPFCVLNFSLIKKNINLKVYNIFGKQRNIDEKILFIKYLLMMLVLTTNSNIKTYGALCEANIVRCNFTLKEKDGIEFYKDSQHINHVNIVDYATYSSHLNEAIFLNPYGISNPDANANIYTQINGLEMYMILNKNSGEYVE